MTIYIIISVILQNMTMSTLNSNLVVYKTQHHFRMYPHVRSLKDLMQRKKKKKSFSFYIDNILIKTSSI